MQVLLTTFHCNFLCIKASLRLKYVFFKFPFLIGRFVGHINMIFGSLGRNKNNKYIKTHFQKKLEPF